MRTLKKTLCLILSVVIISGLFVPAYASDNRTAFIVVSGMNTFPLYDSDGNKEYPLPTSEILSLAGELLPAVTEYLITRNAGKLADKLLPALYETFEPIACSADGDSKYDIHTDTFDSLDGNTETFSGSTKDEEGMVRAAMEKYGPENTFFFNYDWRLDPLEHADALNNFIKHVKETTGCTKTVLAAFSMGGTVTCSYLEKYGSADINCVELCSTAFQGTSVIGDLFRGEFGFSAEALFRRLAQLTRNDNLEQLVYYLNDGLTQNGFNMKISDFANDLVFQIKDRLYDELLIPVFGYMPGLWALCPYDDFDACREYMLKNADEKLLERTQTYHNDVQREAESILNESLSDTCLYIFAQYGMQGLPVSPRGNNSNNDFLIDCTYASGGAVCAELGDTLGEDYSQAAYPEKNYISPDRQIDASTCMFPDKTWFITNMGHVDYPYGAGTDFVLYFAASDTQLTADDSGYAQFLRYDYSEKELLPVSTEKKETFFFRILSFFSKLRGHIFGFFNSLFPKV